MQLSIDFTAARAEGERMAGLALEAAEERGFDSAGASRFIHGWLVRHGATSGEELVKQAKLHGYRGKDDRCFGGVFLGLQNRNLIRCIRSDLPRARGHGTSGGKLWQAIA